MMSYAPNSLLELREYVQLHTGLRAVSLGIIGDKNHTYGYHLGKDRLKPGDYSAETPRDRAGLSNAASANDIGNFTRLVELVAFTVAEARAGRMPDLREVIGPAADGRAYRWDFYDGDVTKRAEGDPHETHGHWSWYRDSEHRDKVGYFRPFFEGTTAPKPKPTPAKPATDWTKDLIMALPTLREGARGDDVGRVQGLLVAAGYKDSAIDDQFGPKTTRAVRRFQQDHNTKNSVRSGKGDGVVGRYTWTDLLGE